MRHAFLLALLAGCHDHGGRGVPDGGVVPTDFLDAGPCSGPVEGFCGVGCPTFEEAVAEVRRLAGEGRCFAAESGTCAGLRYAYHSSGFHGWVAWFDHAGALVRARSFSDVPEFCADTSREEEFGGGPPICDLAPSALYCPPQP